MATQEIAPVSAQLQEVVAGNISGQTIFGAIGERVSMGTTAAGEDIWRGNDLAPAPTSTTTIPTPAAAGEQMSVVSESTSDTSAGTGVQTVRIEYLDADGAQQTEDVIMNGTSLKNTVATDMRFINDFYALTVGSGGVAVGHIKIHKTGTAGLVYNMIALGGNQSLVPHRMVPAGKVLYLHEWHATEAQNKRCAFRIRSTDKNGVLISGVYLFKGVSYLKQSASGSLPVFVSVPALSIVKVSGWAIVGGADASCGWTGVLADAKGS